MHRLEIRLLGSFKASLNGETITTFESSKVRALLAYLTAEATRPQPRERLAGLLWPDWPQRSAMSSLRNALADLRRNLGDREAQPPFLLITHDSLQFNRESDAWGDVWEFEKLSAVSYLPNGVRAQSTVRISLTDDRAQSSNQQSAINNLKSVIDLYRGMFLEGFSLPDSAPFEEWLAVEREALKRKLLVALQRLGDACEAGGEVEQALDCARRMLSLEPWLEEGHRRVMRLLASAGKRSEALAQFETCRQVLLDELGVAPEEETLRLYEQIQGGRLAAPASLPAFLSAGGPREVQRPLFVARQAELERLEQVLVGRPDHPPGGSRGSRPG